MTHTIHKNNELSTFSTTATRLSKNPLGIIALFIGLVYGFASLVTAFSSSLALQERLPLIYFLIFFPVLVLMLFGWLVSRHSGQLYAPCDYKNEENYIRMQLAAAASLAAATVRHPGNSATETDATQIADAVRLAVPGKKMRSRDQWQRQILWVDDHPEKSTHERKAFEALGFCFMLALSSPEALGILGHKKFAAVITNMQRQKGAREGFALLEAIRQQGNQTAYFIYAERNLMEHQPEAVDCGAQGIAGNPHELFELVTHVLMQQESERNSKN